MQIYWYFEIKISHLDFTLFLLKAHTWMVTGKYKAFKNVEQPSRISSLIIKIESIAKIQAVYQFFVSFCAVLCRWRYSLMLICWHPIPGIRPTFDRLAADIQGIIRSLECVYRTVEINLSSSYVNTNTDETYLNPRSASRSTGSEASTQESDLSQFSGFLDTAV